VSEQETVLLVDDDGEIVTAGMLRLRAAGYRVLTACDGESGIAVAAEGRPDVIVLDVRMPGMGGLTALRELTRRSETKEIPVIMLSASIVDEQVALQAGARFFVKKPCRGDTLVKAVTVALQRQSIMHSVSLGLNCERETLVPLAFTLGSRAN
jgi:DNA-binding response OmpR family regulator